MEQNKIGILVPAFNEANNLKYLIPKLKTLGDLLIVNDGSTDETQILLKSNYCNYISIKRNSGYENTVITARNFTVIVTTDSTVLNKWALYNYNGTKWNRTISQRFDTNLYWDYQDWYDIGYNEFTEINSLIDFSYQLTSIENDIGDTVKISSVGSGGWLLLEKIANLQTEDYTQNYKVVGKENATIVI